MQSEREIWQALKKGDRQALGFIFKAYYQPLHHYGMNICQDAALIEDLLQGFFLYLYEHRKNLGDLDSLRSYLFASFRRRLLRRLKSDSGRQYALKEWINSQDYIQFSKEELLIEQEKASIRKSTLIQTLNKLPARQREVIYLRYYNDMNLKEIADVMSISYQAVVNTVYKAFKTLRKDAKLLEIINLTAFFITIFIP